MASCYTSDHRRTLANACLSNTGWHSWRETKRAIRTNEEKDRVRQITRRPGETREKERRERKRDERRKESGYLAFTSAIHFARRYFTLYSLPLGACTRVRIYTNARARLHVHTHRPRCVQRMYVPCSTTRVAAFLRSPRATRGGGVHHHGARESA